MATHELETNCPYCGRRNELHANTAGEEHPPRPGDAAICFKCDLPAIFVEGGGLREATGAERMEIVASDEYTAYINAKKLGRKPF